MLWSGNADPWTESQRVSLAGWGPFVSPQNKHGYSYLFPVASVPLSALFSVGPPLTVEMNLVLKDNIVSRWPFKKKRKKPGFLASSPLCTMEIDKKHI